VSVGRKSQSQSTEPETDRQPHPCFNRCSVRRASPDLQASASADRTAASWRSPPTVRIPAVQPQHEREFEPYERNNRYVDDLPDSRYGHTTLCACRSPRWRIAPAEIQLPNATQRRNREDCVVLNDWVTKTYTRTPITRRNSSSGSDRDDVYITRAMLGFQQLDAVHRRSTARRLTRQSIVPVRESPS
jgi:hypothetical protein